MFYDVLFLLTFLMILRDFLKECHLRNDFMKLKKLYEKEINFSRGYRFVSERREERDTDPVPLEALNYSVLAARPTLGLDISQDTRAVLSDIPGVAGGHTTRSNLVKGSTTALLTAFIHH